MFVAVIDQDLGTSTFSWRKITCPLSLPMSAVRLSHSTASKGDTFPSVNRRWKSKPVMRRVVCSTCELEFKAIRVSAISASAPAVVPPKVGRGAEREGLSPFYSQPEPGMLLRVPKGYTK